jgi:hypothetical protein
MAKPEQTREPEGLHGDAPGRKPTSSRGEDERADKRQSANPEAPNMDEVEEASEESFPASDAPAWIFELPKREPKKGG